MCKAPATPAGEHNANITEISGGATQENAEKKIMSQ